MSERATSSLVWIAVVLAAAVLSMVVAHVARAGDGRASAPEPVPSPATAYPDRLVHPAGLGRLRTPLTDVREQPIGVPCSTCHAARSGQPEATHPGELETFHRGFVLAHGALTCQSCHDRADRDRLRLADGTTRAFVEVVDLCGQCHGSVREAFQHGAHGGMSGYWDRSRGPRVRSSCVICHDPHAPQIPRVQPALPPRDRFVVPHAPGSGQRHP
jgi:hypothetical protein